MMEHSIALHNSEGVEEAREIEVRAGIRTAQRARRPAPLKSTLMEGSMPADDDMTRAQWMDRFPSLLTNIC
jgi:hypothetical protein